jgi:hypothetical protein
MKIWLQHQRDVIGHRKLRQRDLAAAVCEGERPGRMKEVKDAGARDDLPRVVWVCHGMKGTRY